MYGKARLLNLEEIIEVVSQCQKSERRSLYEQKQIEIEDAKAELKVSGSKMMSRGFKGN